MAMAIEDLMCSSSVPQVLRFQLPGSPGCRPRHSARHADSLEQRGTLDAGCWKLEPELGLMRIAVIPGDGIGKDVTAEAVKVLTAVGEGFGRTFELEQLPWSADHYLQTGDHDSAQRLRDAARSSTRSSSARSAIRACPTIATRATSCSARGSSSISTSTTAR